MSDIATLEAHLRSHPDDEPSWLVYADFLLDQQDERGELIHLAHRLAAGGVPKTQGRLWWDRIHAIEAEHRSAWLGEVAFPEGSTIQWRHGFVFGVALPWSRESWHAFETLAHSTAGRFLVSLRLDDQSIPPADVKHITRADAVRVLKRLSIGNTRIGDEGFEEIAEAAPLCGLHALHVHNNNISAAGIRAFATLQTLRSLVVLDLNSNKIGDAGAVHLAQSEPLGRLQELYLGRNGIGFKGAIALATSSTLQSLALLDVIGNPIGPDGHAALDRSVNLRGCRVFRTR